MEPNIDWRVTQPTPEQVSQARMQTMGFIRCLKQHGLYETYRELWTEDMPRAITYHIWTFDKIKFCQLLVTMCVPRDKVDARNPQALCLLGPAQILCGLEEPAWASRAANSEGGSAAGRASKCTEQPIVMRCGDCVRPSRWRKTHCAAVFSCFLRVVASEPKLMAFCIQSKNSCIV